MKIALDFSKIVQVNIGGGYTFLHNALKNWEISYYAFVPVNKVIIE